MTSLALETIQRNTIKLVIVDAVYAANKARSTSNLARRVIKLGEEYGEASEAYLNVTSPSNGKGKTWADVREELADVLIVALDVALTRLEGETMKLIRDDLDHVLTASYERFISPANLEHRMLWLQNDIGKVADALYPERVIAGRQRLMTNYLVLNAFEAALHQMPDQEGLSEMEVLLALEAEITRKLAKWTRNRDTGKVATDAE